MAMKGGTYDEDPAPAREVAKPVHLHYTVGQNTSAG